MISIVPGINFRETNIWRFLFNQTIEIQLAKRNFNIFLKNSFPERKITLLLRSIFGKRHGKER